jgi:hypothetical protein
VIGPEPTERLRRQHDADRAYRRQLDEMDAEAEDGGSAQ